MNLLQKTLFDSVNFVSFRLFLRPTDKLVFFARSRSPVEEGEKWPDVLQAAGTVVLW